MTTIVTRAGKGSPLTNTEVDTNFTDLNSNKLELGQTFSSATANSVLYFNGSRVVSGGSALTFDGSVFATTTIDTTNLEVTNIKANDGTAVMVLTDSTGALDISKAVTMSATTQNIALGTSQTSGTFTVGGAAQTGTQTFDQSTKAHTLNIGTGATENATTKTINIGTGGVSGSTTTITIGAATGTTTTVNGTLNATTLDLTNLEVTNIKAKDGTAAMSIADSTGVVSITANPILSGGTQNGVVYLNSSRVATTGSALTFDGTNFTVANGDLTVATNGKKLYVNYIANNSGSDLNINGATNQIFAIAGTEGMRLTSSGLEIKQSQLIGYSSYASIGTNGLAVAGNVGIGTSSPVNKLDVQAGFISTYDPTNANGAGYSVRFYTDANAGSRAEVARIGGLQEGAGNNGKIVFATSASGSVTEKMTLDSSGNLGLGVPPSAWGSNFRALNLVQFSTRTASLHGGSGQTGLGLNLGVYNNNTNWIASVSSAPVARYELDGLGNHAWFTFNGTVTAGNTVAFTQAMTLDASGNLLVGKTSSGGVGTQNFEIKNASSATMMVTGGSYDWSLLVSSSTNALRFYGGSSEFARISSDGTFRVKGAGTAGSTDAVQFSGSAPADAMRLDSSGNLGIGTSSPGAKLDVNGATARFYSDGANVDVSINRQSNGIYNPTLTMWSAYSSTNVSHQFTIDSNGPIQRFLGSLRFQDSSASNTERARISSDGTFRVKGLGTAGSTDAVQFSGSAPAQSMILDSNGSLAVGGTTVVTNNGGITATTTSSGSVAAALAMRNAGTANGSGTLLVFRGVTNASAEHDYAYIGAVAGDTTAKTGYIYFSTTSGSSPVERARITSGGMCLFGTNNDYGLGTLPGYVLAKAVLAITPDNTASADNRNWALQTNGYENGSFDFVSSSANNTWANNAYRLSVTRAGSTYNTTGTYGTLTSDERLKQDIVDVGSQWADIKALRFRKFKMRRDVVEQGDAALLRLGVIAQEAAAVSPGLVTERTANEQDIRDNPELEGKTVMGFKDSILFWKAAVALQEAMSRIETLEAKIAALEQGA